MWSNLSYLAVFVPTFQMSEAITNAQTLTSIYKWVQPTLFNLRCICLFLTHTKMSEYFLDFKTQM